MLARYLAERARTRELKNEAFVLETEAQDATEAAGAVRSLVQRPEIVGGGEIKA